MEIIGVNEIIGKGGLDYSGNKIIGRVNEIIEIEMGGKRTLKL